MYHIRVLILVLLALGCLADSYTRHDTLCNNGAFWNGQVCLPCLNKYCSCNALYGCSSLTCPAGTVQQKNTQDCTLCPVGCATCTLNGLGGFKCQSCNSSFTNIGTFCFINVKIENICVTKNGQYARVISSQDRWEIQDGPFSIPLTTLDCLDLDKGTSLCESCPSNAFLNEFGQCEQCVTGCALCGGRGVCNTCYIGFYWQSNANTIGQDNGWGAGLCASCPGAGTKTCDSNGVSQVCLTGYFLLVQSGITNQCARCTPNCDQCSNANTCDQCAVGTYSKTGTCFPCFGNTLSQSGYGLSITSCQSCNTGQSNVCDTCAAGFQKVGNGCQICGVVINGCATCSVINSNQLSCDTCQDQFYRVAGANSNTQATCSSCQSLKLNYALCSKDDKTNHDTVTVTQCMPSFKNYLAIDTYFLVPMASNSKVNACAQNINKCQIMKDDSGACTQCAPGYFFVTNACQIAIPNCASTQVSGTVLTCGQCVDGFYSNSDSSACVQCAIGCTKCNSATSCTACIIGFTLNGVQCSACNVVSCQNCDADITKCTTCKPQFFAYTTSNQVQQCLLCPPGCLNCSTSNGQKCSTCLPGYYTFNDGCYQGSPGCAIYNKDGSCDTCQYGMSKTKGMCYPCISYSAGYVCGENAGSSSCYSCYLSLTFIVVLMLLQW